MLRFLKKETTVTEVELHAIAEGQVIPLNQVPDKVFADGIMGEGVGFSYAGDSIYAPCNGEIVMLADTRHAFGMKLENGAEVLIHVGMGVKMRVVKNINNNVSLCIDSQGREVIAFGKGLGFTKPPYEIPLEKIDRTFYDVDECYMSVIADLSPDIIQTTTDIIDYANQKLDNRYSTKVIITLADHIQFAIKREKEHINIKLPLLYEIKHLYPQEMEIGYYALNMILKIWT